MLSADINRGWGNVVSDINRGWVMLSLLILTEVGGMLSTDINRGWGNVVY